MRPNFVRRPKSAPFSRRFRSYQMVLPFLLAIGLAGCGSVFGESEPDTSTRLGSVVGPDRNARGLTGVGRSSEGEKIANASGGFALADEPTAALVARDILEKGGNAADAATALYFTLAVTHPAAAGLGGGGICLVHDPVERKTESVEFLPRRATAGGPIAVPGNVRGFALLHARFGRQSWGSVLAVPERLAATGTPVSRATARSLASNAAILQGDPELARGLLSPMGQPLKELDQSEQIELASTLGRIRSRGVAALYGGDGAAAFAEAISEAGGNVSVGDLRNYRPVVTDAAMVQADRLHVYLPSSNVGAGAFASAMWTALQKISPSDGVTAMRTADATALSLGVQGKLPDDLGSTGFVVVSARGEAVACAVTLNGAFGVGRTARGMGIVLAASPDAPEHGLASAFLAPLLATGGGNGRLVFAGASGGGPAAVAGVQQTLRQSFGTTRQNINIALQNATPSSGVLVNAAVCPAGLPLGLDTCEIAVDPDGAGLGVEAVSRAQ